MLSTFVVLGEASAPPTHRVVHSSAGHVDHPRPSIAIGPRTETDPVEMTIVGEAGTRVVALSATMRLGRCYLGRACTFSEVRPLPAEVAVIRPRFAIEGRRAGLTHAPIPSSHGGIIARTPRRAAHPPRRSRAA